MLNINERLNGDEIVLTMRSMISSVIIGSTVIK